MIGINLLRVKTKLLHLFKIILTQDTTDTTHVQNELPQRSRTTTTVRLPLKYPASQRIQPIQPYSHTQYTPTPTHKIMTFLK